jgi:riboflavin synthase
MFTGIVQEKGKVIAFTPEAEAWRLQIAAGKVSTGVELGDSIAVNGCCLTVAKVEGSQLSFDVLEETRRLTNFSDVAAGGAVNLESSLRFDGKIGGHFVSGHIDGLGVIEVFEARGKDHYLRVRAPEGSGRYLIHKGSIAIDGISLTVAETENDSFAVWLIPTTMAVTNLGTRAVGERVNLEFDLLGKYVEKLLATRVESPSQNA